MAEQPKPYLIGYALAPKKFASFIQPSLVNFAKERGIELIPIDITKPLIDQGPFHCIIHKSMDLQWHDQLEEFRSKYPDIVVIDNPGAIERLHNRNTMLEVVEDLKINSEISLGIPHQVFVESHEPLIECIKSKGISFPVIVKSLLANGSAISHQMYLALGEEGLGELELDPPFVLQEFVNHGGVIFKVYVAGEHVQCVKRRSLPDISEENLGISKKLLPFSQISNLNAEDQNDVSIEKLLEAAELPLASFVNEVASGLRQALGLNLFNFDMIRDSRVGDRYIVIDINYFPGYAKMPNYEKMLTDFFLDILQQKHNVDCESM